MKKLILLMVINLSVSFAANETTANATKAEKLGAPISKVEPEPQILNATMNANDKSNSTETAKKLPSTNENKTAPIITEAQGSVAIKKPEVNNDSKDSVKAARNESLPNTLSAEKAAKPTPEEKVPNDSNHNQYQQVLKTIDVDIEDSVRTGFYILMGISIGALLFVGFKMTKLRLSRAERKYGVQGNRSNQELAPLPLSMEEPDSDDEDQTLFDINRHQVRIF